MSAVRIAQATAQAIVVAAKSHVQHRKQYASGGSSSTSSGGAAITGVWQSPPRAAVRAAVVHAAAMRVAIAIAVVIRVAAVSEQEGLVQIRVCAYVQWQWHTLVAATQACADAAPVS